jgi:shikimate dehydrogenase
VNLPGRLVLIGHPVRHSLSPQFQNAALQAAGIPLMYEALDVPPEDLPRVLEQLRAVRSAGNVTLPHKAAVAATCDRHTALAERTGAVNTFWHEGGKLIGDNTDVAGFQSLAVKVLGTIPDGARIALVGAGGGAAAVCAAVESWRHASVTVYSRSPGRTGELVSRFGALVVGAASAAAALEGADIVVNATPIGLTGDAVPVPVEQLPRDAAVMDLAYRPGQTPWIRAARGAGHRAADGLEMLIGQGAEAFERWFGRPAREDIMRAAIGA